MQIPKSASVSRRALFGMVGSAALLAAAGCNPFSTSAETITVTSHAKAPVTPVRALLAKTRLHVQNLMAAEAVTTLSDDQKALISMLLKDRQAHLTALEAEYGRSIGTTDAPAPPVTTDGVTVPDDPDDVISLIRGDAGQAQTLFTDAMMDASGYRAQLFASIAACVVTHRAVLA